MSYEKYPDDFVKLRNAGVSAERGQSSKFVLDGVDAPYLKRITPGGVTTKKDDFTEFRGKAGIIDLVGIAITGTVTKTITGGASSGQRTVTTVSKQDTPFGLADTTFGFSRKADYKEIFYITTRGNLQFTALLTFVGERYVFNLQSSNPDIANGETVANTLYWPVLTKLPEISSQFEDFDPKSKGKSITYINTYQLQSLSSGFLRACTFASGYDNTANKYRFGFTAFNRSDPDIPSINDPVAFSGSTGALALTQRTLPLVADTLGDNKPFAPFVIGKGRIQSLQAPVPKTGQPLISPYLANSTDHGDTWTAASAAFVVPYLRLASGLYDPNQLGSIPDAINTYLGKNDGSEDSRSMFYLPAGWTGTQFVPMIFLGTNGQGYTRVSWPPDAWPVNAQGLPTTTNQVTWATEAQDLRRVPFGFGRGCMYVPVKLADVPKIMFTRDYGATWAYSSGTMTPELSDTPFAGVVMTPYESDTKKGRILFPAPNYTKQIIEFFRTDGEFNSFKKVLGAVSINGLRAPTGLDARAFNYIFTKFGGAKPSIFPAFPKEFEKP